jgi:probable HAF family extracellular repeat protein
MTDLGFGLAAAINGSGLVVGDLFFPPNNLHHAFLYDGNDTIDLGNLGESGDSEATAINNTGQIVGTSLTPSLGQHAFRYESATGMVDLDPGGATAVNDAGQSGCGMVPNRRSLDNSGCLHE